MDRDSVIVRLRQHETELRNAGILHLRLHGSVARGEASPVSDVDLIAEFDPARRLSLLDMIGLENQLADLLGAPVDLASLKALREVVRDKATREGMLAF
ncbi:MAG: nucleotidyltransferase domain-containing protein [Bryobacterales bacterium]|nr:nucleotidyltransferase domain-containing protein [Bryobacterales bacterium]